MPPGLLADYLPIAWRQLRTHFVQRRAKRAHGVVNVTVREGVAGLVEDLSAGGTIEQRGHESASYSYRRKTLRTGDTGLQL
jgi:hypothetical protein